MNAQPSSMIAGCLLVVLIIIKSFLYTVDRDIFTGKISSPDFSDQNWYSRCTLHKIFCVINFHRKRSSTKNFNTENFTIYGIQLYALEKHGMQSIEYTEQLLVLLVYSGTPSIMGTIGIKDFGQYRGVAANQGLLI